MPGSIEKQVDKIVRKRRRPAKSCEHCRLRKIRCDQLVPCSSCVRSRASLQCSYCSDDTQVLPVAKRSDHDAFSASSTEGVAISAATPAQSANSQQELLAEAPAQRASEPVRTPHTTTIKPLRAEESLDELRARIRQLERQAEQQDERSKSVDIQVKDKLNALSTLTVAPPLPRLRNGSEKAKIFGPSHWFYATERVSGIGGFNYDTEPPLTHAGPELSALFKEVRALRQSLKLHNVVTFDELVPELTSTFPSREVCDELVRCYLRSFEPMYRIVHIPTLWDDYDHFWDVSKKSSQVPGLFKFLLGLIMSIGSVFIADSYNGIELKVLQKTARKWIYAAQWWLVGPSERASETISGLQICCLLIIARKAMPGFSPSGWLSSSSLVNMAIRMGLHRHSTKFAVLSPFQAQLRARLWATVVELVCQDSLESSTRPFIEEYAYDAAVPLNLNDIDIEFGSTTSILPSVDAVTDCSIQILLSQSLSLRLQALRLINDWHGKMSFEEALHTANGLKVLCADFAAIFNRCKAKPAEASIRCSSLVFSEFHRNFIDVYIRKYILLLNRPFMFEAQSDPRFYLSRKICVDNALIIGSWAEKLVFDSSTSVTNEPDYGARLSMRGHGVFKGAICMDVIIVLAYEIISQLQENPASGLDDCDPVTEIHRTSRQPLINTLERLADCMLQQISRGVPSLKRYIYASTYLNLIRVMDRGGGNSGINVQQVICTSVTESLQTCRTLLMPHHDALATSTPLIVAEPAANGNDAERDIFDFANLALDMQCDLSNFLVLPFAGEQAFSLPVG
ncbi:uncharacterized protein V1518DRAFT_406939 [Limtongia smithiae]|uniref:uncharacterized protein n=1 Tax=Limtongia smithiae TaxID=1125753 RepID=UPI0034CEFD52